MRRSDYQREENCDEYLRLLQNSDYQEVTFDEESGGVSAVHRRHKFDKQQGAFGMRRSDYERVVLDVLRRNGYRAVLSEETNDPGVKSCDGYLNDLPMEIKSVEGTGLWSISKKLRYAEKQHAQILVLYYPNEEIYNPFRVNDGLRLFLSHPDYEGILSRLLIVVKDRIEVDFNKKTTPIEGWSIQEGLRR